MIEFVSLMKRANVSPHWIINENIKQKLIHNALRLPDKHIGATATTQFHYTETPTVEAETPRNIRPVKRKLQEEDKTEPKRLKGWDYSDEDEE